MNQLQYKDIIKDFPPILDADMITSLDLELSGLKESQLHRPFGRLTSLAGCFDGETVYIVFGEDEVQEYLNRVEKSTWIFHNSTFDLGHLRRWATIPERKNLRDTLLIERLLYSNYYTEFGLNHLVRRYLGCYMPKDIRKEFHDLEGAMTEEQIEYAALDVIGTWLVDKEQQKIISDVDKKIWDNLYNPHVWTTLELGGFKLDVDAWRDLAEKNQEIVDRISTELGKKYGVTKTKLVGRGKSRHEESYFEEFNPSSPMQVKAVLLKEGIKVESTDDKSIRGYAEKSKFVHDILEYRKADKQVSTYGLSFLKNVEDDGRIYTSLNISLAETGRDCVHVSTELDTKDGPLSIGDLNLEDRTYWVRTHTGKYRRILRRIYKGMEEMYKVITEKGYTIMCTMGHRFLTLDGDWKHLYQLGEGSYLMTKGISGMDEIILIIPVGKQDVWDIEVDQDHSYYANGFINHNSSSSPNLQNIPGAKERRKCFIASEGKVLVLYDYSGQEVNIWAYLTQDPIIKEILASGKKFYLEVARLAFNEILTKESPRYKVIKALVLGLFYGLTPYGFARDNEMDVEEAEKMFNAFFDAFPVSAEYVQRMQSRNTGKSFSIIGRTCHLHPYDISWKNNALNSPMQSSAGDMIKLAMKKMRKSEFYQKYHPDNKVNLLLQVHDEIITEVVVELAKEWEGVMRQIMIEVAESLHPGIKGGVSGGIIQNWSEKE